MDRSEAQEPGRRVFVSYSRRDARPVRAIAAALERRGHDVWSDVEDITGGAWAGRIVEAIQQSDVFLLVLTSTSVGILKERFDQRQLALAADHLRPTHSDIRSGSVYVSNTRSIGACTTIENRYSAIAPHGTRVERVRMVLAHPP